MITIDSADFQITSNPPVGSDDQSLIMDIDKEDEQIDTNFGKIFMFCLFKAQYVKVNTKMNNPQQFKDIVDVYLSKHNIPYTRDSSGSMIVYRCPFDSSCSFCVRGGVCRSKVVSRRGMLLFMSFQIGVLCVKQVQINHTCNWQSVLFLTVSNT